MIKMNEEFEKLFSTLSEKDQKEVANLIRFKNEVKYHDKQFEELLNQYIELSREYDKLQNNWNELKNWLIQLQKLKGINQQGFSWGVAQEVLDKMQELEQGKDENKRD